MTVKNLLLALLLLSSFLLWRWLDTNTEPEIVSIFDPSRPDFIAKNLYSVAFDEKGQLSYRIFADSMTHFEIEKQTLFEHPVVLVYPEEIRPIWQLTANTGLLRGQVNASVETGIMAKVNGESPQKNLDSLSNTQEKKVENIPSLMTVSLSDDVKIVNLTNNEYVKQMTTSSLELDIREKTIHTLDKVYIEGLTYDLEGVGLVGNLSTEQVDLQEEVHAIYHQE